ncbi:myb-related transcription factor, partner of profilin-like [Acipenser oxyrinchus oxyrinchus]|uniref:Myb-related transcription factor, partner of profilin-like n=1 Tax=Acipenser oxyrinchus oxyrinchus TaxID=40147 RepID=A0AAD8D5C6_ACIOX|nr:myb-related transcription factor, partner of profilin-like [Acipenser oxyrinchus oxyrinchus]
MAEVVERWDELFGARSLSLARSDKARIWQDIATRVSAPSTGVRDGEDVRTKWTCIKQSLRTKVAAQRTSTAQTGEGVNTTPELTPLEQRLLSLMGHECVGGVDAPDVGFVHLWRKVPAPWHRPRSMTLWTQTPSATRAATNTNKSPQCHPQSSPLSPLPNAGVHFQKTTWPHPGKHPGQTGANTYSAQICPGLPGTHCSTATNLYPGASTSH